MVEHLVMGLKTSPNHIGLGSALETGGWQFIDQHGHMRRLKKVNLSGFHRSQAKEKPLILTHHESYGTIGPTDYGMAGMLFLLSRDLLKVSLGKIDFQNCFRGFPKREKIFCGNGLSLGLGARHVCGMQPKPSSLRAQAQLSETQTETCELLRETAERTTEVREQALPTSQKPIC
ncbi:hypothetical protein TNCV_2464271 [Trichonephila clavipes]|nr:hypothetical protein TNCV_2464271 [Trichonephila clavipes]